MEKVYIGKVEALEIAIEWGNFRLPRKGNEIVHVPSIASLQPIQWLGKDDKGFYIKQKELEV